MEINSNSFFEKINRNKMDVIGHSSALGCRMGIEDVVLLLLGHAAFTPSPRGTNYLWAWEATLGVYSGLGTLFWEAALGNELTWGTDSLHAWGLLWALWAWGATLGGYSRQRAQAGHISPLGLGGYSVRLLWAWEATLGCLFADLSPADSTYTDYGVRFSPSPFGLLQLSTSK